MPHPDQAEHLERFKPALLEHGVQTRTAAMSQAAGRLQDTGRALKQQNFAQITNAKSRLKQTSKTLKGPLTLSADYILEMLERARPPVQAMQIVWMRTAPTADARLMSLTARTRRITISMEQ